ncbi:MAG: hypothetical protein ACOH18_04175 [Candidatus Saccharimonadaceae bacterium]
MDITPQDNSTQSISDDQELAKALAGVLPEDPNAVQPVTPGMQFEETPAVTPAVVPASFQVPVVASTSTAELDGIKLDALKELRPLMDKVDLPAEEKFDTYLMLIRSTDDSTLIGPAHTAAQGIGDEKRKAEALLEIIKEIDYLSRKDQPTTSV